METKSMANIKLQIADLLKAVVDGWCGEEKAYAMAELILSTRPTLIVELGIFGGRSLLTQAIAVREMHSKALLVGVDPWRREAATEGETGGENEAWWSSVDLDDIHSKFMGHLWGFGLQDHCIVMRCTSDIASRSFCDRSIDILHIDSNHSEEVSCREVRTWLPLMKTGGMIWMDDLDWKSTLKAQGLLHESCTLVRTIDDKCGLFRVNAR